MDVFPLSAAQLGMWYAQHLDPEIPINIAQYVDLRGDLDIELLERASIRGSEELGSGFLRILEIDGTPHQVVDLSIDDSLILCDFRESADPVAAARAWMQADCRAPVDLLSDRLIVAAVLQLEDNRYFWYSRCHHIVLDGFGAMNFMKRVAALYTAALDGAEPTDSKAADLLALYDSDIAYRNSSRFAADGAYWAEKLAGIEGETSLSGRNAAPSAVNRVSSAALSTETSLLLERAIVAHNSSPAAMLIVAFASYLAHVTGKEDVVLSLPVTARTTAVARHSGGMVSNVVPLRVHLGADTTVAEVHKQVQATVSGALRRQRYRHEDMRRGGSGNSVQRDLLGPLVNIMLFHDEVTLGPMLGQFNVLSTGTVEDLGVNFYQSVAGTRTHIDFETNPAVYTDDDAREHHSRFLGYFERFLAADAQAPLWSISVVGDEECAQILRHWNATDRAVPETTLVEMFDAQVPRTPDATALSFESERLTYREFDSRVNRLARYVMSLGVGPESLVALDMRRSVDLLVGIYAVLKAGGAYVPVDPDHPADRVAHILDTARPVCVLSTTRDRSSAEEGSTSILIDTLDLSMFADDTVSDAERVAPVDASNLAYVIFTSGSTGRPKGVAISHGAVVNRLVWMQAEYPLTTADVVLQKTPTTFDVSVWELFWPLQVGAKMVIATPDGHRDPQYLSRVIVEESVSTVHFVPSMLAVFAAEPSVTECTSLRQVFTSGEALGAKVAAALRDLVPTARLCNLYGPTEAAVDVTYHEVTASDAESVPIGVPVWNTQVYVLDTNLRPTPIGVVGELYLGGVQLARGYIGRPELTADRFIANPYSGSARMYRTGDLVSWSSSGELKYIGRSDFQVKLRGLRIELGEVEAALESDPGIGQAVVVVRDGDRGQILVGYVVPVAGAVVDIDALEVGVRRRVPAYMVPDALTVLDALPLNTSGKLDRKLLPEPIFATKLFRAPRTPVEEIVANVFADILGVAKVGLDDNFFELGGNSLIANQVVSRVGAAFGIRLGVRALFETQTVVGLSDRVGKSSSTRDTRPPLVARRRPDTVPLSLAQQRMWFLNRYDCASGTYNLPLVVRLCGPADVQALRLALSDVLARHESLRTVFPETGVAGSEYGARQVVLPVEDLEIDVVEESVSVADLDARLAEFASVGFDVRSEIPFRAAMYNLGPDELAFAFVVHHIAADGLSWGVLARDVMVAYVSRLSGEAPNWAPLPVQYADYSMWQREVLGTVTDPNSMFCTQLEFWKETLADLPEQLDLPTDRPRPLTQSFRGGQVGFELPAETVNAVTSMAAAQGVTSFMVMHTALAVLLARLTGTSDIVIGTPVGGRGEQALDDIIGMFVNTLVLRTEIDPSASFRELLAAIKETDLAAFENSDVPFESLVQELNPTRSTARQPLFQVVLVLEPAATVFELPGLSVEVSEVEVDLSKFDLQLTLRTDTSGGMSAEFGYATDLFDQSTVAGFAERFVRILESALATADLPVGDIEVLSEPERVCLSAVRGTVSSVPRTLSELMVAAAHDRGAGAIVDAGRRMTYGELDAESSRLARVLIEDGAGPEVVVAVALPRSIESVLGIWALAKTGAAFLPVDPKYPADRIKHMLEDSGARSAMTIEKYRSALPAEVSWIDPTAPNTRRRMAAMSSDPVTDADRVRPLRTTNPAYVIYTSGSTGLPNGVVVTHAGLVNLCLEQHERYEVTSASKILHFSSPSFDASILELTMMLGSGATMVIAPPDIYGGEELAELIREQRISHAFVTPAALGSVDSSGLDTLQVVVVGGESCSPELVNRWAPGRRMFNAYGPTEATVFTTIGALTPGEPVLLGGPIRGAHILVLDERLHPVPHGVTGELYLAGDALARGYLDRHALTSSRFVANPYGDPSSRIYRTGDLVSWTGGDHDRQLEYRGRSDHQVKIRGFRIELGEIDTVLSMHPDVDFVLTVGHKSSTDRVSLVSYVHPATGVRFDKAALSSFAATRLPGYMLPAAVVALDEVPLTPGGKVDRKALPEPVFETRPFREPTRINEKVVAATFAEVLGLDQVGLDDDFFELGGNSLIATQVAARLGAELDITVAVRTLFEATTVHALAEAVSRQHGGRDRVQLSAGVRPAHIPLSTAQQRMWFLNRFDSNSTAYNLPMAWRLSGEVDAAALNAAVLDVVARHESLRTVFPDSEQGPHQVVLSVDQVTAPGASAGLSSYGSSEAALGSQLAELFARGFDVRSEIPVRAALFGIDPQNFVLAVVIHHISADGWSMAPLARDVMIAYAARKAGHTPAWAPLPVQYPDFSLWQREVLGYEDDAQSLLARQCTYWREALDGVVDQLDLPADRPRPAVATHRGARHRFAIDADMHKRLDMLAREHGTTLFMVIHTALSVLLARLSGSADISIGTPIAGRGERALDDVIGMFVNTVVLRTEVESGRSFTQQLAQTREVDLGAFEHADVPFERIVEVLNPARSQARHPLFQVMLAFRNTGPTTFELPGLGIEQLEFDEGVAKFDLQLDVAENFSEGEPVGLAAEFHYATDLFDADTVATFALRLFRILDSVIADPATAVGDLDILDPSEVLALVTTWNNTVVELPDETLVSSFVAQVSRTPDASALTFEGRSLTYSQLDVRVNRLARRLITEGVGPDSLVALAARRSIDLVVGMYAILTAGGAYVPIDPDQPVDRTTYVLDTADPVCVLTAGIDSQYRWGTLPVIDVDSVDVAGFSGAPVSDVDRRAPLRSSNTAYVIFTSGSTGRPKGVAVTHAAISNRLSWMQSEYWLSSADVVVQKTPFTFDVSVWELFWPLQIGARLVVAAPGGHRDPKYLMKLIAAESVTIAHFVPSMLSVFAEEVAVRECRTLQHVFASGEALSGQTVARLRDALPGVRVHNLYGPTEAAVDVTYHEVVVEDVLSVPIGAPVWNTRVYVLDSRLHPVPVGVEGELYLAGEQLARGYVGRADLTAERFVANPFVPEGGSADQEVRMYRTGDLVSWSASGELLYIGRTDFQVKLRGLRIELGEIEAALAGLSSVSQAVVIVQESSLGQHLVGYVVPAAGAGVDVDAAKAALGRLLPAYMVPDVVTVLAEFPLGSSGKLDRAQLPKVVFENKVFCAPQSRTEEVVAATMVDLLDNSQVGLDDNFFELGGNSLIATQLVSRIGAALDVHVPVGFVFEAPTVGAMAELIDSRAGVNGRNVLIPQERGPRIPLSLAQSRMWFLNQFDVESAADNIPVAVRLTGTLDVDALRAAVADVVARHEVLRTLYPATSGEPEQLIVSATDVPVDLTPKLVTESELGGGVVAEASRGFDVTTEVPVRVALFQVADGAAAGGNVDDYVLMFVVHHIAADGFSMRPLVRDVMLAYEARSVGLLPSWLPLAVQYADYSLWQRDVLGSEDDGRSLISTQLGYWEQQLAGLPLHLELPGDRPRPATVSRRGSQVAFTLDADMHRALTDLARANNATVFMVVHAAVGVLMARLSGTSDIAIGTPFAGRGDIALDDLVGMFVNTLVLRTHIDADADFETVLERSRAADIAGFANADLPFEHLVEVLNPTRSQAWHPLFQVGLTFQNLGLTALTLPGLDVVMLDVDAATAKFDLQWTLSEIFTETGDPAGINAELNYATDLFDRTTAEGFVARFGAVLDAVTADPTIVVGDIEILDPIERDRILADWNSSGVDSGADVTLTALFHSAAMAHSNRIAVRFGSESLTYRALDDRANRLARALISVGVGPETLVAVALSRSTDLIVALLAVIKAGGGYLPVDPNYPADRIEYMLSDALPVCVLTTSDIDMSRPTHLPVLELDLLDLSSFDGSEVTDSERSAPLEPGNVAYVIYTSGSTGRPKGVMVPHRNVARLMRNTESTYGFDDSDVWTMFHSYAFDFSVWELWGPLLYGGTLVVVDYFVSRSPQQFLELLRSEKVTVLNQTPSAFYQLAEADRISEGTRGDLSLRYVIFGGEVLEPRRLADWFERRGDRSPTLVNMYGITETTVHVSHRVLDAELATNAGTSIVGQAIAGLEVFVVDGRMRPVPVGVPGEIYIAGPQLARGYLGLPALTASRFVANPFTGDMGSVLYRSGDLARWNKQGELEYLGRADDQVKVRGFRIELGEVETALLAQSSVGQAAVVVREDVPGDAKLVAYVVPAGSDVPDSAAVRASVAALLPEYMVPSAVMIIDEIALTANGKLDRKALPAPVFEVREFRAPTSTMEKCVADVFASVLGVPRVGLDDDFFELGGNSLIAAQLMSRLGAALEARVPVRTLFDASTVESLAASVALLSGEGDRNELVAQARPARLPLSSAQQRMWFLNRFDSASVAYNIPMAIRLSGQLNVLALQWAINDVFTRHESLRTKYPESVDGPMQVIVAADEVLPELVPRSVSADALQDALGEFFATTFDVTTQVPVRISLFEVGHSADEYVLASVIHHISADGASMSPFARDVMTAYAARVDGRAPSWIPLPVQYADYALWQRDTLGDESEPESIAAQQIDYWKDALSGLADQLDLPTDRPRPPVQSFRGGRVAFEIDASLHRRVIELGRMHGATLFMAAHSALAILLSRLSGSADIAVGTPIAGRGDAALDGLIGMFVNTLALRTTVDPAAGFADVLASVRETDLEAFANADIPFERLVEVLNPTRSTARHPLFQVGFSFQNLAPTTLELPGLIIGALDVDNEVAQFDLHLFLTDRYDESGNPAGIDAVFGYAVDLFDEVTVRGFTERFVRIFESVVSDPATPVGDIDVLGAVERDLILGRWNDTAVTVDNVTLADLVDRQVALSPNAPAIWFDDATLTYGEFDAKVNRLARKLIGEGVGPEILVVLAIRRSVELMIAMYAVVKAGGAYVPVDPDHPPERVAHVLSTADARCVLTTRNENFVAAGIPTHYVDSADTGPVSSAPILDSERIASLNPAHPAYVIFTSGSTGRPKGVSLSHRAVVNQLTWMRNELGLGATDSAVLKTAATFDLSVWEFWASLVSGGRLVIARAGGEQDPDYLLALIREQRISTLHAVPSMLSMLSVVAAGGELSPDLRRVLAIGEVLPAGLAQSFRRANSAQLFNLYGPTEAAVSVTSHLVVDVDQGSMPIGGPEWNSRLYVLDARLNPVPAGVPGELYLAGSQLARGYHGRADLTSDRFVASAFGATDGERMYRTGDLVKWAPGGVLEYLARSDFQVKLRGFRIELGEIESVFAQDEAVETVVVMVRHDKKVGDRLVAYLVAVAGRPVDVKRLTATAAAALPSYMVPAAIMVLDNLPLTVNGKLDRDALPDPAFDAADFRVPVGENERLVAGVFASLLSVGEVGLDDDFFALGGNSLVATQVAARLGEALHTTVPVLWIFEAPTVQALAERVGRAAGDGARVPLRRRERPVEIPLSLAQQRMWVLNQMMTDSALYNVPAAIRLSGTLNVDALEAAVRDVVERHEVLRTVYPDGGEGPVQVVAQIEVVPLDLTPEAVDEDSLGLRVVELASEGFDVTTAVPLRVRLFAVSPAEHVLVVVVHHIAADGFSMGPLTRDLMVAYSSRVAGGSSGLAPLDVQYVDYSLWQREVLGSETDPDSLVSQQLAYWTHEWAGLPEQLELPADHPRPARRTMRGGAFDFEIGPELTEKLSAVARENNSTLFMVIHSAFAVLLAKLSGQTDIAIGTPVAGRGERVLDDVVGMFVNTVVLRLPVSSSTNFVDLLAMARQKDLTALSHADIPFERLVDAIGRERSMAYSPVFQVMFAFQNTAPTSIQLPGLKVEQFDSGFEQAKFDLQLSAEEVFDEFGRPMSIRMQFTYALDLFRPDTIERFAERLDRILDAVASDPGVVLRSIDILTAAERQRFARKTVSIADELIKSVPLAAEADPDAIALEHAGRKVTYGQLAGKLRSVSKSMGAVLSPEEVVAVTVSGLIPGILAALGADGHAAMLTSLSDSSGSIVAKRRRFGSSDPIVATRVLDSCPEVV